MYNHWNSCYICNKLTFTFGLMLAKHGHDIRHNHILLKQRYVVIFVTN